MKKLYLLTGATGHLGTVLLDKLLERKEKVRVLTLASENDMLEGKDVEVFIGDVTKKETLEAFFERSAYDKVTLIHAAALISISSRDNPLLWKINVGGTVNILNLAMDHKIERVIYVSSVHAIPEKEMGTAIEEVDHFSIDDVHGQYSKSKAAAAQKALEFAEKGLNLSIVHPSGMIGPGDLQDKNHSVRTIKGMQKGTIFVSIKGGYDFVDSRDVADGILACEENGRKGECYLLSGFYITVTDLLNMVRRIQGKKAINITVPYGIIKAFAPIGEWMAHLCGRSSPIFTPYSVSVLHSNSHFSHEKASREFGYKPRPIEETVRATMGL